MNIAIIGYGKMGKAIEEIAIQRGHKIVLKISIDNTEDNTKENLQTADVAIEFSGPESAFENIIKCVDVGLPVVCGSTGWLKKFEQAKDYVNSKNGAFIYASNFSVGVNIFFALNERLAELMAPHSDYDVSIKEVHHTQKLDAPSGTAISIAEQILERIPGKKTWVNNKPTNSSELPIISERKDPAPGTHSVGYYSYIDDIEIIHTAHNRKGFATGAVLAAEFLKGKKGIFTMRDVLGIR
jgi:4-hydroxy-tetrahydrodipicolinate reductase